MVKALCYKNEKKYFRGNFTHSNPFCFTVIGLVIPVRLILDPGNRGWKEIEIYAFVQFARTV